MDEREKTFLKLARELVGEENVDVLEFLLKKKTEMTDKDIANELGVKDNDVRKKLYILYDNGFVTYRKTRDKENGWYIYYWRPNLDAINEILIQRKRDVLNKLKARLASELNGTFYYCPNDGFRADFETAMENDFKCIRCGTPLEAYDAERAKTVLTALIKRLEEEIDRETKLVGSSKSG